MKKNIYLGHILENEHLACVINAPHWIIYIKNNIIYLDHIKYCFSNIYEGKHVTFMKENFCLRYIYKQEYLS